MIERVGTPKLYKTITPLSHYSHIPLFHYSISLNR